MDLASLMAASVASGDISWVSTLSCAPALGAANLKNRAVPVGKEMSENRSKKLYVLGGWRLKMIYNSKPRDGLSSALSNFDFNTSMRASMIAMV